ncbi:MAG: hypothetical protein ABSG33_11510 [Candidatus Bathyarchaeia archaeon]
MVDYLVGTGGWAYFNIPNKPALKAYSEIFSFMEVNSTTGTAARNWMAGFRRFWKRRKMRRRSTGSSTITIAVTPQKIVFSL